MPDHIWLHNPVNVVLFNVSVPPCSMMHFAPDLNWNLISLIVRLVPLAILNSFSILTVPVEPNGLLPVDIGSQMPPVLSMCVDALKIVFGIQHCGGKVGPY